MKIYLLNFIVITTFATFAFAEGEAKNTAKATDTKTTDTKTTDTKTTDTKTTDTKATAVSTSKNSNSWECKKESITRKVEVKSTAEGKAVPCQVVYTKENETEGKVLYNAEADETFCETKAKAFTEKLASMGFTCE